MGIETKSIEQEYTNTCPIAPTMKITQRDQMQLTGVILEC